MKPGKRLLRVCLTPRVSGVGGMVSFQAKLSAGLAERGIAVTYDIDSLDYDSLLVIGGTRQLGALRRARRRGIPVVQRLDGINWLHRRLPTGARHWLRAESGNWLLTFIRRRLASRIVYQSSFVRDWWERQYGPTRIPLQVTHNGVDLNIFSPKDGERPPKSPVRLLLVEGSLMGGYEFGLRSAIALAELLQAEYRLDIQLSIAGRVSETQKAHWKEKTGITIQWLGVVAHAEIPALNHSAHLLYSADLNAACPNAVIEAMACGLPVLTFDTGALNELVTPQAGRLVAYGGDPWKLEQPDIHSLARAAVEIIDKQASFRAGARARAEEAFGLDAMVEAYIDGLGAQDG